MVNSDDSAREQPGPSPAVTLALTVLLGDAFVADAEPAFLESFGSRDRAWADVLKAIWALAGGNVAQSSQPPAAHREFSAQTQAAAAAAGRPAPASPTIPLARAAGPVAPASAAAEPEPPERESRVEIFDPSVQEDAAVPTRDRPWTYEELRDDLVKLLEDATGYPVEVLEEDADLEGDLAIDSVKQVEALGALRERYGLVVEDDFAIRDYRTIRKAAAYLTERLNHERLATAVN
jgi:acyl carrier protein